MEIEEHIDKHRTSIRKLAWRYANNRHDAADVEQAIILKMIERHNTYDHDHESEDDEASAIAAFYQFAEEVRISLNYRLAKVQRVEEGIVVQEWFGVAGHREEWYPEAP